MRRTVTSKRAHAAAHRCAGGGNGHGCAGGGKGDAGVRGEYLTPGPRCGASRCSKLR